MLTLSLRGVASFYYFPPDFDCKLLGAEKHCAAQEKAREQLYWLNLTSSVSGSKQNVGFQKPEKFNMAKVSYHVLLKVTFKTDLIYQDQAWWCII